MDTPCARQLSVLESWTWDRRARRDHLVCRRKYQQLVSLCESSHSVIQGGSRCFSEATFFIQGGLRCLLTPKTVIQGGTRCLLKPQTPTSIQCSVVSGEVDTYLATVPTAKVTWCSLELFDDWTMNQKECGRKPLCSAVRTVRGTVHVANELNIA
jgi:hypothetical protein